MADVFPALERAVRALGALDCTSLATAELLYSLGRLEAARRQTTACAYDLAAAVPSAPWVSASPAPEH